MIENQFELWAAEQLDAYGLRPTTDERAQLVRNSVLALAHMFGEMHFDMMDPGEKLGLREQVLQLFAHLAAGKALPAQEGNYIWRPARNYAPSMGQVARIRFDAYKGTEGVKYNGRMGHIVHLRRGIGLTFDLSESPDKPEGGTFPPGDVEVAI